MPLQRACLVVLVWFPNTWVPLLLNMLNPVCFEASLFQRMLFITPSYCARVTEAGNRCTTNRKSNEMDLKVQITLREDVIYSVTSPGGRSAAGCFSITGLIISFTVQ